MITIATARNDEEREACFRLRYEVFVVEQGVPVDLERDEHDGSALHLLAWSDGKLVGTARAVLKEGNTLAKIGRVAVASSHRGLGIGRLLMTAFETAPELESVEIFQLHGQTDALPFYLRLGYEAYGNEFMEAGLCHRQMRKSKDRIVGLSAQRIK